MKIYKRGSIIWNMIIFQILSIIYIYIQNCLLLNNTAFNIGRFGLFILDKNYYVFFLIISFYCAYKVLPISKLVLISLLGLIFFETTKILIFDFNKLIFLMGIIHLIFWIIFLNNWFYELKRPVYNPLFSRENLEVIPNFIVRVDLTFHKEPSTIFHGILTNWGENDCFILMTNRIKLKGRKVNIKVHFKNKTFSNDGEIITTYDYKIGLGLKFYEKPVSSNNDWLHLYQILRDMGLIPEYIS